MGSRPRTLGSLVVSAGRLWWTFGYDGEPVKHFDDVESYLEVDAQPLRPLCRRLAIRAFPTLTQY